MDDEQWKVCIEDYEISNRGNIRRKMLSGGYREVKGSIQNRGYKYFQLSRDGKRNNYLVHHLVAQHFISERPEGNVIDHIDRDKLNNRVENLRYTTQKGNVFNADRVHTDIPQDSDNRHSLVCKKYREANKEKIYKRKSEKLICEKCNNPICRAYMTAHLRLCDGSYARSRSGRHNKAMGR